MINLVKQKAIFWIIRQQDLGMKKSIIEDDLKDAKYPKDVIAHLLLMARTYRRIMLAAFFLGLVIMISLMLK